MVHSFKVRVPFSLRCTFSPFFIQSCTVPFPNESRLLKRFMRLASHLLLASLQLLLSLLFLYWSHCAAMMVMMVLASLLFLIKLQLLSALLHLLLHDSLLWLESLIQQVSLLLLAKLLMLVLCLSLYCFWCSCCSWRLLLLLVSLRLLSSLLLLLLPAGVFTFATEIAVAGNIAVICWCCCWLPCCCMLPYRILTSVQLCVLVKNAEPTPFLSEHAQFCFPISLYM